MKIWAEYLDINPITGKLYNPVGDRSIVMLDARFNINKLIKMAVEENGHSRPKYHSVQIMKANHFREQGVPVTEVIKL